MAAAPPHPPTTRHECGSGCRSDRFRTRGGVRSRSGVGDSGATEPAQGSPTVDAWTPRPCPRPTRRPARRPPTPSGAARRRRSPSDEPSGRTARAGPAPGPRPGGRPDLGPPGAPRPARRDGRRLPLEPVGERLGERVLLRRGPGRQRTWKAFFCGSFDAATPSPSTSRRPSLWAMALSVRLFGLSSFAILLPQVLMGVGTVGGGLRHGEAPLRRGGRPARRAPCWR